MPNAFMDQGEFGTSSSIADIIEVECEEVYAEKYVRISANELYSRCDRHALLADALPGTATRAADARLRSGPGVGRTRQRRQRHGDRAGRPLVCGGESLIAAHLESAPYTTVTTGFTVLPPRPDTTGGA